MPPRSKRKPVPPTTDVDSSIRTGTSSISRYYESQNNNEIHFLILFYRIIIIFHMINSLILIDLIYFLLLS